MSQEIVSKLSAPFKVEQVKTRLGSFNPNTGTNDSYSYVSADDVLDRLRDVFGASFSSEYAFEKVLPNKDGRKTYVVIGVELAYYDEAGKQHKALGIGGKDITGDPGADYKAALSKAVKSAAKLWGVPVDGGLEDEEVEGAVITTPTGSPPPPKPAGSPPAPKPAGAAAAPPPKPAGTPAPAAAKPAAPTPAAGTAVTPPKPPAPKPTATAEAAAPAPAAKPKPPAPVPAPEDMNLNVEQDAEEEDEDQPTADGEEFELDGDDLSDDAAPCNDCGGEITDDKDTNNNVMSAEYITQVTLENFGVPVCAACVRERKKKDEA